MDQNNTINREAHATQKGPRLQKMRAIKLMLEKIKDKSKDLFYSATENIEDVSLRSFESDGITDYLEEDKNYSPEDAFTINSGEVTNTLVSFFDIYITWRLSNLLSLGFYTTARIGKERKKQFQNGDPIIWPEKPMLEMLIDSSAGEDEYATIQRILIDEYKIQYPQSGSSGNLSTLEGMSAKNFGQFLKLITWHFGQSDEKALHDEILTLIKGSAFFNSKLHDKESYIFAQLMELLDSRQGKQDFYARHVNSADVELVFSKAESGEVSDNIDPVWAEFERLKSEIKDKRNLKEKIKSVSSDYDENKIRILARRACAAKLEQSAGDKKYFSLRYRIYEACSDILIELALNHKISAKEIDELVGKLINESSKQIEELKKDYTYTATNIVSIRGIVLDLIDSCFIAFDEENANEC